jgi:hypothetical protein
MSNASTPNTFPDFEIFHKNQINVAKEINTLFHNFDFVHLQAQMQSGKTGACLYAVCEQLKSNTIDTFYVLSGISDLDLKNQWIEKIDTHYDNYFKPNPSNNTEFQYHTLLKQLLKSNVYFGKSIKHIETLETLKNSIIILDEIHYGSSNDSIICKLFKRLNIKPILEGNSCELLKTYNIKILVVTATAANLDAIYNNTEASKNWGRVYMEPGPDYKGVLDYYTNHNIYSNFNIKPDDISNVVEILNKYKSHKKYMIFRAVTQKSSIIIEVCKALNIPYIYYDQEHNKSFDNIEPQEFTCVLIKSKLRVGKELHKEHICAVFETSLTINTDTLLQGLFGRVCGYNITNSIDIYISTKNMEDIINEFRLINKPVAEASMTRTKFVKNYVNSEELYPTIKLGSMHT